MHFVIKSTHKTQLSSHFTQEVFDNFINPEFTSHSIHSGILVVALKVSMYYDPHSHVCVVVFITRNLSL